MAMIQSAIEKDEYTLDIVMTNHNRLLCNMLPYLDMVQFCPLKDKNTWKHFKVADTCLIFPGIPNLELSIETLLELLIRDKSDHRESVIEHATIDSEGILQVTFQNMNQMEMDLMELVQFPLFTLLGQKELRKTMRAKEHSLSWKNQDICIEISIHTLLQYFLCV